MMMDETIEQRVADAVVLHLARDILEEHGALGDERLVAELTRKGLDERYARASLTRLEEDGYVAFGDRGWTLAPDALPMLFTYASAI